MRVEMLQKTQPPATARAVRGTATLSLNLYAVVARAVEEGIARGWRRAHKHTESPEEAAILDEIEQAVLNALSEVVLWPGVEDARP